MEKKTILILVIGLVLVIIGGALFTTFNNSSQVSVGDAVFKLPSGFHKGQPNSAGDINITNDYDSAFIKEYETDNITKVIKDYKNYKNDENHTVKISNSTINNITVYKSSVTNETYTIHYWFVYKNKVYSIYTWGGGKNFDSIATDLIKSLN